MGREAIPSVTSQAISLFSPLFSPTADSTMSAGTLFSPLFSPAQNTKTKVSVFKFPDVRRQ